MAIGQFGAGLTIMQAIADQSSTNPLIEAALFSGTIKVIGDLILLYPNEPENVRLDAWRYLIYLQSCCADHVKCHWTEAGSFRTLASNHPDSFNGRSPDVTVFTTAAKEILLDLFACLQIAVVRNSVPRSKYGDAIPCLEWLCSDSDVNVASRAKGILDRLPTPKSAKSGCLVILFVSALTIAATIANFHN